MMLRLAKKLLAFSLLTVAVLCATSTNAYATHFRYGTLRWRIANPAQPNVVTFDLEVAFRSDFFSPLPVLNGSVPFVVGDSLIITDVTNGGAGVQLTSIALPAMHVTAINGAEDWFIGTASVTYALPINPAAKIYKASYTQCCRLSTLADNNHDINYIVWTQFSIITAAPVTNHAPVASSLPILTFAGGTALTYQVPAVDADGDPLTYRLATAAESGLNTIKPSLPASGSGAFNLSTAGVVTWTPPIPSGVGSSQLYALQVVVTDSHNASTMLDFILKVVNATGDHAPTLTLNGSSTNLSMTVPPGQLVTIAVHADDPDSLPNNPTPLFIASGVLPDSAVTSPALPATLLAGINANATLTWTPTLDDLGPHVLSFSVTDDKGLQTIVSATVTVDQAAGLYLSGVLRDFPSGTTDFGRANDASTPQLVLSTLGADGKPVLNTGIPFVSILSSASFANWWSGGQASVYTAVLSNFGNSNPRMFTLDTTNFGAGHSFFTYELHSYYTYNPGDVLSYRSSDDLWVFINGQLVADMGGVHSTPRTATVNTDTLGLTMGITYPMAFFYAHRSIDQATIGLSATPPTLCDPVGTPAAVSLASLTKIGGATVPSDGFLHLSPNPASAAWTNTRVQIANGFSATFSFKSAVSGNADGLAFVLQDSTATALGAGPLGYSGIPHSVAVEFDAHQDTVDNDPAFDQVSVHTRFDQLNSAIETTASVSSSSNTDPAIGAPFTFDDGVLHQVRVQLVAPVTADPTGIYYLRAFVDGNLAPAVNASFTRSQFATTFPSGQAFLGFTSGNPSATVAMQVQSFAVGTVAVSGANITAIAPPSAIDPGTTGSMKLQLRDTCLNPILNGGVGSNFAAAMTTDTYTTPVTTTDDLDGTFTFSYTPVVGGDWLLGITYSGLQVQNSPFHVSVSPATPTVAVTDATFTYDSHAHASTGTAKGVLNEDLGALSFTYNGDSTAPSNAGGYAVVGTFTADAAGHYATASSNGSLTINPATPTIDFSGGPFTYDATAHSVTATVKGVLGEVVGPASVQYDGSSAPPTDAGTYPLHASFSASGNYGDATADSSMTIGQATPTVSVSGGPFTYDATAHAASGSVTGVNGADLGAPSPITYNGDSAAPTDAGTYALVGSYAGSKNYKSTTGNGSMTINRATPSISVSGGPFTYDATPHGATVSVTGVNNTALSGASITYDSSSTPPTNAGAYALKATYPQSLNYETANATGSMTINRAKPTVKVTGGVFVFDGSQHPASGSVVGVNNTALGTPSFTYDDQPTVPANAGTYHVVGSYAGDTNYEPAQGTAAIEIDKATPTITWATPSAITYGTALSNAQLNATASVAGSIAYTPGAGTVPGAGSQKLTADFTPADSGNYNTASTFVMLAVNAAPLTIAANDAFKTYGGPAPAFTASYNGLVNSDTPASLAGVLSFGGPATSAVTVGSYDIVPSGQSSSNYSITFQKGTLHIDAAPLVITANDLTKVLGQPMTFSGTEFTASGLVLGDAVSSVTLTSAGAPASATLAGSPYDIVPSNPIGTGLGNYAISYKNGKLTVVPSPPTIVSVTPSLTSLWPVNHKMVPITIDVVATSLADPSPVCTIDGVTSNEPIDADGDWAVTPNSLLLSLRADRLGAGSGRIYTVTIRCADRFGNAATKTTTVSVPHDQGR